MIINGKHAILEALQANHPLREIVLSSSTHHHQELTALLKVAKTQNIPIHTLPSQEFKQRYPENTTQGIIATSKEISFKPLSLLIDNPHQYPVLVILDHLEDPYNMGAIIRTCEGLGVNALLFGKDRQVKLTPGVIKAASGAVYHLPLIQVSNIAQSITQLKKAGYWIYGTDVTNGHDIATAQVNHPFALIIGNEHKGISKHVSKMVDLNVHLPMHGHIESLNVSVATGIILYTLVGK
jgi:23S rRNA (guanosine2251-2'-O)-methyltransferase